jgi:hypothetical protein
MFGSKEKIADNSTAIVKIFNAAIRHSECLDTSYELIEKPLELYSGTTGTLL